MLYLTFIDDDVNDNEFDDEEEYVKEKKVVKKEIPQSLNNFYPACTLFFILYGPYGVLADNFDITPCLSIDSKGIDEQAKRYKNMNCANNASTKIKMINQDRDTEPGRGMSAHHMEKFGIAREETSVIKDQFYRKNLMESFNVAKEMAVRSINTQEQTDHWYRIMDEYAREISPTLLLPKPIIPPSKVPSVRTTPAPETIPQTKITTASKLNSVVQKLYVTKELETIPANIVVLTQDSEYYDPNDFIVEEPEREKRIPITVSRERIVKEIREKEQREKEDRRNKDEEEDTEGEPEFIEPYLNTIKTVNPYPPRDSLTISEREQRDREDDEYMAQERIRRDVAHNIACAKHYGTTSSTISKVRTRGVTRSTISKMV